MQRLGFSRDVRHALRMLVRTPAFSIIAILTFAVAIGATAAMFGLVNRLMLAPPPGVENARQVMRPSSLFRSRMHASRFLSFSPTSNWHMPEVIMPLHCRWSMNC